METQKLVAEWYAKFLWPGVTSAGSGRSGNDVVNAPADVEVKGRRGFSPLEAVKQLKERVQGPFGPGWAVMRMDGQGEKSVGDFLVIMTLADHTAYMKELQVLREAVPESVRKSFRLWAAVGEEVDSYGQREGLDA